MSFSRKPPPGHTAGARRRVLYPSSKSDLTKFLAHISEMTYKEGTHMKQLLDYSRFIVVALLLAAAAGCATSGSSENLLAAAGFQQRTADTPKKQETLNSLPRNQLPLITWNGKNYYVQPDSTNANLAWVGSPAEFQTYQQLRLAKQLSNDNLMAAQMNQAAMMSWRGAWGPGLYGGFGRWR